VALGRREDGAERFGIHAHRRTRAARAQGHEARDELLAAGEQREALALVYAGLVARTHG
jgi:hypothetical protein